jgi:predicted HTH domain antitoxin
MNLTLPIPDDLGERFSAGGEDLARRALEAFAVEEYRNGRLTLPELGRLLGYETRAALDGLLKARGIYEECTLEDIEQDIRDLRRLGL